MVREVFFFGFLLGLSITLADLSRRATELHYTLRYVEKHSRDIKNPWSMRQMAVCHRANIDKQFSSWILVHAGHDLQESLCVKTDKYPPDEVEDRAATVHLTILHFAARNWSAYLDYLSSEFKQIVSYFIPPNRLQLCAISPRVFENE